MYNIVFYRDSHGCSPAAEYIRGLKNQTDKDSRIKLNKISDFFGILQQYGTRIGAPYVKHLEDEIWELRPLRDRFLFAAWIDGSFIILHQFTKKTNKTPRREIQKAQRELSEIKERRRQYGHNTSE